MGSNVDGMKRTAPRAFVASKRIKSLHRTHRKHGGTLSLKAFGRERVDVMGAGLHARWSDAKRRH